MDFNNLEKQMGDGNFSASKEKVLEHLMHLTIENNSMLIALLESQAKINSIVDPSKTKEEYRERLNKIVSDNNLNTFAFIMGKIGDK